MLPTNVDIARIERSLALYRSVVSNVEKTEALITKIMAGNHSFETSFEIQDRIQDLNRNFEEAATLRLDIPLINTATERLRQVADQVF